MVLYIQRRLNGLNEIIPVEEVITETSGVRNLGDFLKEIGLSTPEGIQELAQVLKIPVDQLVNSSKDGLIEGSAQENIRDYLRNSRIPQNGIEFLQRQQGEAGIKNVLISDHSDFKDDCG